MDNANFWGGKFGDEYTDRNRVKWRSRIPFFETIMEYTGSRSVLEYGCNAGWNLSAINACSSARVQGVDINFKALNQAKTAGLDVMASEVFHEEYERSHGMSVFELVFTAGCLIHMNDEECFDIMPKLAGVSCDYVMAIEYASDKVEEVLYRGHDGRLFKRPYGSMYEDLGLELLVHEKNVEGFDNCDMWLLRKPI